MPMSTLSTYLGQLTQMEPYIGPVFRQDIVHADLRVYNNRVYDPIEIYRPLTPSYPLSLAKTERRAPVAEQASMNASGEVERV